VCWLTTVAARDHYFRHKTILKLNFSFVVIVFALFASADFSHIFVLLTPLLILRGVCALAIASNVCTQIMIKLSHVKTSQPTPRRSFNLISVGLISQ